MRDGVQETLVHENVMQFDVTDLRRKANYDVIRSGWITQPPFVKAKIPQSTIKIVCAASPLRRTPI